LGLFCMTLKKNMIYEINPSWVEKTSIEVLKNSGSGKMPFPFMFWPIKYSPNFHSSSRKLLPTASMLFIAFQEISLPWVPVENFILAMRVSSKQIKLRTMNNSFRHILKLRNNSTNQGFVDPILSYFPQ
jgi:hypothetical protein